MQFCITQEKSRFKKGAKEEIWITDKQYMVERPVSMRSAASMNPCDQFYLFNPL
jgi:hypothetical protein